MKKAIFLLMFIFVLGFNTKVFSASNPFSDVPTNHWAYDAVMILPAEGIIEGYGDGSFRGDRNITRYEAATMLAKVIVSKSNTVSNGSMSFTDIPSGHWARDAVALLSGAGISNGYSDGSFRGDNNITRYEMAVMISKLISGGGEYATGAMSFIDVPTDHWAADAVKFLASKGINEGYEDGTFRGDKNMTRYEVAAMLARVMVLM